MPPPPAGAKTEVISSFGCVASRALDTLLLSCCAFTAPPDILMPWFLLDKSTRLTVLSAAAAVAAAAEAAAAGSVRIEFSLPHSTPDCWCNAAVSLTVQVVSLSAPPCAPVAPASTHAAMRRLQELVATAASCQEGKDCPCSPAACRPEGPSH